MGLPQLVLLCSTIHLQFNCAALSSSKVPGILIIAGEESNNVFTRSSIMDGKIISLKLLPLAATCLAWITAWKEGDDISELINFVALFLGFLLHEWKIGKYFLSCKNYHRVQRTYMHVGEQNLCNSITSECVVHSFECCMAGLTALSRHCSAQLSVPRIASAASWDVKTTLCTTNDKNWLEAWAQANNLQLNFSKNNNKK